MEGEKIVVYPSGSSGRKMISEVLTAKSSDTIKNVLDKLKKTAKDLKSIDYIYVVDNENRLVGVVSIKEVFSQPRQTKIVKIMHINLITVSPHTDLEKAANLALVHNINAVPVVEKGKLLGILPSHKIHSILNKALKEDILHFAGIHKSHLEYENTLAVPLLRTIYHRLPWLVIGLIGIIFTARVINLFDGLLEKHLILAFFIPAIVYMSDALGTQHQTLFVRDIAVIGKDLNIGLYFLKQMVVATILGICIGAMSFLTIFFLWNEAFIAFIISLSMLIAMLVSGITSLMITFIINKLGMDPALGSGPFATVVSDLTSVFVYLVVALMFLGI